MIPSLVFAACLAALALAPVPNTPPERLPDGPSCPAGQSHNDMSGCQPDAPPFPGAIRAEDGSWVPPSFYPPTNAKKES